MVPFKKYVTCIIAFFTPIQLCHTLSVTLHHFPNERKEDFLHIWLLHRITLYQKRKKPHLQTIEFLETHAYINNPH